MKKIYKTPSTEVVNLNIQEKITWGGGANQSNQTDHPSGKEDDGLEDEDLIIDEEGWDYDLWGDN